MTTADAVKSFMAISHRKMVPGKVDRCIIPVKTWLGAQGQPHSDEMRTIERYRRVDANTIQFNLTIDDPKTYTKTWETEPRVIKSRPGVEIPESFCVASEEEEFTRRIREPAARKTTRE